MNNILINTRSIKIFVNTVNVCVFYIKIYKGKNYDHSEFFFERAMFAMIQHVVFDQMYFIVNIPRHTSGFITFTTRSLFYVESVANFIHYFLDGNAYF